MVKVYRASGYDLNELLANIPVEDDKIISISHKETIIEDDYDDYDEEDEFCDEEGFEEIDRDFGEGYKFFHKIEVFYKE